MNNTKLDRNMRIEQNECNRITKFLKNNEIWFKTVLSLAMTVAAFFVSLASYRTAQYQVQLTALSIENENLEKQPFFSIHHDYDEERQQYIYRIVNTGGTVRYCDIHVIPYVYVYQWRKDTNAEYIRYNSNLNQAFIQLHGFINYEPIVEEREVLAFSDIVLDGISSKSNPMFIRHPYYGLANDYLMHLCSWNNSDKMNTAMSSQLIYHVQVSYYDYKNERCYSDFCLARSSDTSGNTEGNNRLYLDYEVSRLIDDAKKSGLFFDVDSLNLDNDETVSNCEVCINTLFEEFDQI